METEPNYYAIIPADVRYDKDLPANAKLLYGEIGSLANKKGYCFAANAYFAELFGISERQITRLLNSLAVKGYISISEGGGRSRKIYICHAAETMTKMSDNIDKNVRVNPDKNVGQNNTSINNKKIIYTPEFEKWYARYPNKFNKQQTFKNWKTALKSYSVRDLYTTLLNYERHIRENNVNPEYITRSTNFLGKKGEFIGWLEKGGTAVQISGDSFTANPPAPSEWDERMRRFNDDG